MRHQVDGRKFGRNTSHRVAMLKNLANSVIDREQVVTTLAKAKEGRRLVDRLITLGKTGTLHTRRLAFDRTRDEHIVKKLFSELAERYKNRAGGYTRVRRLSETRYGDGADMALLELVDHKPITRKTKQSRLAAAQEAAAAKTGGAPAGDPTGDTPRKETQAKDPFAGMRKVFGGKRGQDKAGNQPKTPGGSQATPKAVRKPKKV